MFSRYRAIDGGVIMISDSRRRCATSGPQRGSIRFLQRGAADEPKHLAILSMARDCRRFAVRGVGPMDGRAGGGANKHGRNHRIKFDRQQPHDGVFRLLWFFGLGRLVRFFRLAGVGAGGYRWPADDGAGHHRRQRDGRRHGRSRFGQCRADRFKRAIPAAESTGGQLCRRRQPRQHRLLARRARQRGWGANWHNGRPRHAELQHPRHAKLQSRGERQSRRNGSQPVRSDGRARRAWGYGRRARAKARSSHSVERGLRPSGD